MKRRLGFTLIELLMVLVIMSILSGLGLLRYIDLRNTARAAALSGDFRAVFYGSLNYYADHETWPPESGPGSVPSGLGPYLPGQLASFDRGIYTLDYENLSDQGGTIMIGISVTAADPRLMAKFISTLGSQAPYFVAGNKLTYVIAGPSGVL